MSEPVDQTPIVVAVKPDEGAKESSLVVGTETADGQKKLLEQITERIPILRKEAQKNPAEVVEEISRVDEPTAETAQKEQFYKPVKLTVEVSRELGIYDQVFLQGGLVVDPELSRAHHDVDIVVKGKEEAALLVAGLVASGQYDEPLEDPLVRPLPFVVLSPVEEGAPLLDIQWVEPGEKNGVRYWMIPYPEEYNQALGRAVFGIPESAFSSKTMNFGGVEIRHLCPEYIFLATIYEEDDKHASDREILQRSMNQGRLEQIKSDMEKAGIIATLEGIEEIEVPEIEKPTPAAINEPEKQGTNIVLDYD